VVFMEAVNTARNLGLETGGVYEMCTAIGQGWSLDGAAGAVQAVEDFEAERRRWQSSGGGGKYRASVGSVTTVHRLRELARSIAEVDPDDMVQGCLPADRVITVELLGRTARRIAEIAAGLNRAAAGER